MKRLNIFRSLSIITISATVFYFTTSCNSCDRNTQETNENTYYDTETDNDTIIEEEGAYNNAVEGQMPSDSRTNSTTIKRSTTSSSASASVKQSSSESDEKKLSEAEITNMVENSDAKSGAVDKNGNPIRSSGSAGTGQGTGTGSTGNNSRVTTREAQRN